MLPISKENITIDITSLLHSLLYPMLTQHLLLNLDNSNF